MKKWTIRISLVIVVLLVAGFVTAAIFLGKAVKKGVETEGPVMTSVDVKLNSADVWLFDGRAQLKGLLVGNPQGYKTDFAIKVGDISVKVKPLSVFSDKVVLTSITIKSPEITIEGGLKNNNLSKIQKNLNASGDQSENHASTSGPSSDKKAPRKLQVDELIITGAKLHVNNPLLGGKTLTVSVPDIHLTNLGASSDGITPAELARDVMNELMNKVVPATMAVVNQFGKDLEGAAKKGNFKKAINSL
jgi:uncharacterized protein involved in outer membrane biogenesis